MYEGTKMQLRLPQEVKGWLKDEAIRNDRSMNNQVVSVLREKMKECGPVAQQMSSEACMQEVSV